MAPDYHRCNSCKNEKILNASKFKVHLDGLLKTCLQCLSKRKNTYASKKNLDKENLPDEEGSDDDGTKIDDALEFVNMSPVNLDAFLDNLSACDSVRSVVARVDVARIQSSDMREMADGVAKAVWDCLKYRFM